MQCASEIQLVIPVLSPIHVPKNQPLWALWRLCLHWPPLHGATAGRPAHPAHPFPALPLHIHLFLSSYYVVCPYLVATPAMFFNMHPYLLVSSLSCCVSMASSIDCVGNSPDSEKFSVPIVACLLVHITGHRSKMKTTKKDTKIKEFSHTFSTTKSNYLEFLTTVLTKHHIGNKLQVTDRRCYIYKMQVPSSK